MTGADEHLLRVGAGLGRTGSPAGVYLTGRDVGPDEPHLEVARPVR